MKTTIRLRGGRPLRGADRLRGERLRASPQHPREGLRPFESRFDAATFGMHLIAALEQPVDVGDAAATRIQPYNRARASVLFQVEHLLSCFEQGLQRGDEGGAALKQLIGDNLAVATGDHTAQLASAPVA